MENKEQIRQSLEDIYNQILPTLEKLEVKRLESVKIKKRYNIRVLILMCAVIAILIFCFIFIFMNFIEKLNSFLYLLIFIFGTILLTLIILPPNMVFNKKDLKYRLMYKLVPLFNLHKWNDTGFGDEFEGKYKDVKFYILETSNKLNINFNTKRFYKVKTTIYTKGSRPKYNLDFDKLMKLFCLGLFILGLIPLFSMVFFTCLKEYKYWDVYMFEQTNWKVYFILLGILGLLLLITIIYFFVYLHSCKVKKPKDKLNLESVDFKNKFEVYGDEVEGRYALTTAFMNRLLTMQTAFGSGDLTCIIDGNNISFEIKKTKDLFEVADLNKPVNSPECIKEFYNEMTSIWDMIDHFKLDENTGL